MISTEELISRGDINTAGQVIGGVLHRTPVQPSTHLGNELGLRMWLKLEMFQKSGSFKTRGVLNRLHHMSESEKQQGVVTLSAGNHAQAVAWAAASAGIPSTVVMPEGAVQAKVDATRDYGGEVVSTTGDLLQTCMDLRDERGLTLIHPFDHLHTIAGTGTVGQEIIEDVPDVDLVVVGVGGGGLISGVAAALKMHNPNARVIGVEPDAAPTMTRSLYAGKPLHLEPAQTIADGLAAPFVGHHNLAHVQAFVDDMVLVTDAEIVHAMALILERCKILAEPAAASSVAALLSGKADVGSARTAVCVLSGGNIDCHRLAGLIG